MQITWVNAAAFFGLGLIALPIAIHLLVRQHTRAMPYPSLRFLRETALAAFRRRRLDEALLLLCRVGILVVAVLALAGPIVQTPARTASHSGRTARAHISVKSSDAQAASALASDAFRFASFSRLEIADAIRDAVRWLNQQPPASREIVFSGTLTRGSIDAADLLAAPPDIGIRFLPEERRPQTDGAVPVLELRNGALLLRERRVHLEADSTSIVDGSTSGVAPHPIDIVAAPKDQPAADAALRAALERGIRWTTSERQVLVVWDGADTLALTPDVEVIRMPVPAAASAADAIWQALDESAPMPIDEPIAIAPQQLEMWTRKPGPPSPQAPQTDEGDRRWLWVLALILLGVEQWLRRAAKERVTAKEARVA